MLHQQATICFSASLTRTVFVAYLVALTALLLRSSSADELTEDLAFWLHLMSPVAHLLSFAILAALAFACRWPVRGWIVVLLIAGYAAGTELLQGSVSGRTSDWMDWCLDLVGAAIGIGSLMVVRIFRDFKRDTGDAIGACLIAENDSMQK